MQAHYRSCSTNLCIPFICQVRPSLANWPTYIVEESGTAVVPCIPGGEGAAYFWTKGDTFEDSEDIASRVLDIPSSASERYLAATNGSLFIFEAKREDEGAYYCRIVSEKTNCHGAVTIFVQGEVTFTLTQPY